ncbi:MAG: hypothetical protein ACRCW4_13390 [Candidatus Neomicrothrix subdominans]
MARRGKSDVEVKIKGDADFSDARRAIKSDYAKIEADTRDLVKDIERVASSADIDITPQVNTRDAEAGFARFVQSVADRDVELDVDLASLREAFDLAEKLDELSASIDVDADLDEIRQVETLARELRSFTGRLDLDVQGTADLREALGIADALDRTRAVKVELQGRQDLERAAQIADDLERRRTVPIDAQASDLVSLESDIADAVAGGGEAGAEGMAGAIGDFDFTDVGGGIASQLVGGLSAAGPWAAIGVPLGAAFGEDFIEGFTASWGGQRVAVARQIRGNLSDAEMADVGTAAGAAYAAGFKESGLDGLKDTAVLIQGELGRLDDDLDLTSAIKQAEALSEIYGTEVTDSIRTVQTMLSRGMVDSADEGFRLLNDLAQLTGQELEEMMTSADEFGAALGSMGIDGAQGLRIIGQLIRDDIFAQADQAGEVFEEFNEIVSSGQAAEALERIGLNAREMQDAVADGRGAEAMSQISDALLKVEGDGERAALAAEIFGGNMLRATDSEAALRLFGTADAIGEVTTELDNSIASLEASQSSFERLKTQAAEFGGFMAEAVSTGILPFTDALDAVNPAGKDFEGWVTGLIPGIESLVPGLDETSKTMAGLSKSTPDAADGLAEMGESAGDTAGEVDGLEEALAGLESQFESMFNFSADQLFRDITDEAIALGKAMAETSSESIGLGGEIDITKDFAFELQEQLESLNGVLQDNSEAFVEDKITAAEWQRTQNAGTDAIRRAGQAAGLTQAQIQGLIDYYARVPPIVSTKITAEDNATRIIGNIQSALGRLRPVSIPISASNVSSLGINRRARGGSTTGLTLVGEEGPELADFRGQAYIYTAKETREILAGTQGTPLPTAAPSPVAAAAAPGTRVYNVQVNDGRHWFQELALVDSLHS